MTRTRRGIAPSDAALLVAVTIVALSIAVTITARPAAGIEDRARSLEAQLRCPTCQGLSIADSPATSATQMRSLVQEQLTGGASDEAVRAFFVARYGRWILLDPPSSGPDLVLWLAPAAILATGAGLVVLRTRRVRATPPASRSWTAGVLPPVPHVGTVAIAGTMLIALVIPIAVAIGPRLAGEISGGGVTQAAPSIEDLEAFVRAEPRDVAAIVALGDALLAADRAGEAADRYRAALEIDPDDVAALLGVGTILLAADRPDAAEPVFDRILAVSPDQPDALLYRALVRVRLAGTPTDAVRRDVERFLALTSPSDPRRAMATALLVATAAPSQPGRPSPTPPGPSAP